MSRDSTIVIALAAYRPPAGHFVSQLASIAAQTHREWRCIVTLDSPLAELRTMPGLEPYLADPRFEWHENPERLGHCGNFARAIALAVAAGAGAIATADQDDVWFPEKLAVLAEVLDACPPLSLVHSDMVVLDDDGTSGGSVWQRTRQAVDDASSADLLVANVVTGCSMLFDAGLARRYPEIPRSFSYHDHWFALAASCHGGVRAVARPLLGYRQHSGNVVGAVEFDWSMRVDPRGPRAEIEGAVTRWRTLRQRTRDAIAAGMPLPRSLALRYGAGADLGFGLLLHGLMRTISNPRFSRAAIRAAAGRMLDLLSLGRAGGRTA
jgi:hypothetical protein